MRKRKRERDGERERERERCSPFSQALHHCTFPSAKSGKTFARFGRILSVYYGVLEEGLPQSLNESNENLKIKLQ